MSCVELNFWIKGEVCVKAYLFIHLFTYVSEKAMASHSNTLAWRIPWTEEPGRLQSMGSQRVGHDWATSLSLFTFMHWRRTWQPTPVFLSGGSQGWGSLMVCSPWNRTELDTTEAMQQQQQQHMIFLVFKKILSPLNWCCRFAPSQLTLFLWVDFWTLSWPVDLCLHSFSPLSGLCTWVWVTWGLPVGTVLKPLCLLYKFRIGL